MAESTSESLMLLLLCVDSRQTGHLFYINTCQRIREIIFTVTGLIVCDSSWQTSLFWEIHHGISFCSRQKPPVQHAVILEERSIIRDLCDGKNGVITLDISDCCWCSSSACSSPQTYSPRALTVNLLSNFCLSNWIKWVFLEVHLCGRAKRWIVTSRNLLQ